MKKTKLLIPALSVASVGAIVAPIVTSCASQKISFDIIKDSKIVKFTSMDPKTATKYTDDELNIEYAKAIQDNPNIVANDMFYTYSTICKSQGYNDQFTRWTMAVSDVSTSTAILNNKQYALYSLTLTLSRDFAVDCTEGGITVAKGDNIDITFRYNNTPFTFAFDEDGKITGAENPLTSKCNAMIMPGFASYMPYLNTSFEFTFKQTDKEGKVKTLVNQMLMSTASDVDAFSKGLFAQYYGILVTSVLIFPHYFMNVTKKA